MMVFVNESIAWESRPSSVLSQFLILLQPFAPHLAEELWSKLQAGTAPSGLALAYQPWPKHDPQWLLESSIELAVQVNGKLRDRITVAADASEEAVKAAALASEKIGP